jgi:acylphosphatase
VTDVRLTVLVRGRVQGVGFRYWVRGAAGDLGLRGTATNLPDGRVEVIAEGPRAACEQLLDALGSDRPPGWVGDLTHTWGTAQGLTGFRAR